MPRSAPRGATAASSRPEQPNEMSDIWKPVRPSGRYRCTRDPAQAGCGAGAFGVSWMRKSWVPYLHPPARVRPPAAAPRRNARRLRSGSRRSLSGMTSPASPGARTEAPGDLALELREVATDHRQLERAQDRLLGFTLEQELERQADQLFDGDALAGQLLVVRRRHGHAMDRVGFALGDGDAEDVRTLGAHGDARDHGHPTPSTYRGAENPATPVLTGATAGDGDPSPGEVRRPLPVRVTTLRQLVRVHGAAAAVERISGADDEQAADDRRAGVHRSGEREALERRPRRGVEGAERRREQRPVEDDGRGAGHGRRCRRRAPRLLPPDAARD